MRRKVISSCNDHRPPDDEDCRPFDRLQYMYRCYLGQHILATLQSPPKRILDISRSMGRWASEVADENEDVTITWMNPFPYRPLYSLPDNCSFTIGDLTEALGFDEASMDFVHSRYEAHLRFLK